MECTGYVLVGGRSTRMGRDKALLPWDGVPLVRHVARAVESAAGIVKLVGEPERYGHLDLPVIADLHPGCGPLGGVEAALADSGSEWNLVVACDMPGVSGEFLTMLLDAAAGSGAGVAMPVGPGGRPEPLCAAWNRTALGAVEAALESGMRRMTDILPRVSHVLVPVAGMLHFRNLNTPEDWAAHAAR